MFLVSHLSILIRNHHPNIPNVIIVKNAHNKNFPNRFNALPVNASFFLLITVCLLIHFNLKHIVNVYNSPKLNVFKIVHLGKINYNDYIRRYLGEQPGDVIELETGRRIGEHRGLWFHTIGQRKGMGFSGGPWFVVRKDVAKNILYVSHGYDPESAYKQDFTIHDFHPLTLPLEDIFHHPVPEPVEGSSVFHITFKIRHTPGYLAGTLEPTGEGSYIVHAKEKIHGVAPGQFCVVYDAQHHRCLGSGEIQ